MWSLRDDCSAVSKFQNCRYLVACCPLCGVLNSNAKCMLKLYHYQHDDMRAGWSWRVPQEAKCQIRHACLECVRIRSMYVLYLFRVVSHSLNVLNVFEPSILDSNIQDPLEEVQAIEMSTRCSLTVIPLRGHIGTKI